MWRFPFRELGIAFRPSVLGNGSRRGTHSGASVALNNDLLVELFKLKSILGMHYVTSQLCIYLKGDLHLQMDFNLLMVI